MTKKEDIMGYLRQVQRMQLEATKMTITLAYWPNICGFRLIIDTPLSKDNDFVFWSEYSEEENRQSMEQLTHLYNQIETTIQ